MSRTGDPARLRRCGCLPQCGKYHLLLNRVESSVERSAVHGGAVRVHEVLGHMQRGTVAECGRSRNSLDTDCFVRLDPGTCDVAAAELVHGLGVGLFCCRREPLRGLGRQALHEELER